MSQYSHEPQTWNFKCIVNFPNNIINGPLSNNSGVKTWYSAIFASHLQAVQGICFSLKLIWMKWT